MTLNLIEKLKTSMYNPKAHQQHENTCHFQFFKTFENQYFKTKIEMVSVLC